MPVIQAPLFMCPIVPVRHGLSNFAPSKSLSSRGCISSKASPSPDAKAGDSSDKTPDSYRRKRGRLQHWAAPNARLIHDVKKGEAMVGTVRDVGPVNSAWVDVNVATVRGRAVRARLRLPKGRDGKVSTDLAEGSVIPVHVHRVTPVSARLEVRRGLEPPPNLLDVDEQTSRSLYSLNVGERLEGTVVSLGSYGAVVDVGVHRVGRRGRLIKFPGLLPRRHFGPGWGTTADSVRRADADRIIDIGDRVTTYARIIYPDSPFLLLDACPVDRDDIAAVQTEKRRRRRNYRRRKPVSSVKVGDKRRGIVREMASFGVFIDLGLRRDGLLHYSAMDKYYASNWKETLLPGTAINVEIVKINEDNVAVRLISVPETDLNEAVRKAAAPTATPEDIKHAALLKERERLLYRKTGALVNPTSDTSSLDKHSIQKISQNSEISSLETDTEQSKNFSNGEDDDDEYDSIDDDDYDNGPDKFSEEYFEDKYG